MNTAIRVVVVVVLDSAGIGGAPDAHLYGDEGSATLPNLAAAVGGIALPHLAELGLGHLARIEGVTAAEAPRGAFGSMVERSPGKDTTTGHWELMGVTLDRPFPVYPDGFPSDVIDAFERAAGVKILGNVAASGTEIIEALGPEHLATGRPIVYTSADSVFQIAAHVDVIPLERLYEMCRLARAILVEEHEVGRVIARPFAGEPGSFRRTPDRHDFSVLPPRPTVLDAISSDGMEVLGIGKIGDIFGGRGLTSTYPTASNDEGVDAVIDGAASITRGLVFANLVDFDQAYGHRNDPEGYAAALEAFDTRLPEIEGSLAPDAALIITADHGNDPTTPSTDHSREKVPVLCAGAAVCAGADLGQRASFADCGATVAELLGVPGTTPGASFAGLALGAVRSAGPD